MIVRLSHLGDIVQTLPLAHALRTRWPAAAIGWAIQPEFADLVRPFAEILPFDRRGGLAAWPRLRRALREFAPELTVDAQGNLKSAAVTRLSGAPRRVGMALCDWRERLGHRALTESAAAAPGPHLVQRVLALSARLAPGTDARFDPELDASERESGRAGLRSHTPEGSGSLVLLHPGVDGDRRSWSPACFAAVARTLAAAGRRVLILTGPGEAEVGERLARELADEPAVHHWVGQRGLRSLAAVFAAAGEAGGRLMVGDSGPAHLAAAVGLPVDLLAGPMDPDRTGPWPRADRDGSPHRVLARHVRPEEPWLPRAIESIDPARVARELIDGG